jgi:ankyrin repeat protein
LILAADRGLDSIVRYLQQHKANCDLKNNHGDTALMAAAGAGMSNIVRLLIDAGADGV